MRNYAKPGEGLLSKRMHKKLENFLFGEHYTLSVVSLASVFISGLIFDQKLQSYYLATITNISTVNIIDAFGSIAISIALGAALLFLSLVLIRVRSPKILTASAYTLITTVMFLVAVQYFWNVMNYQSHGLEWILILVASYHLFSGFVAFRVALTDTHYLTSRIHLNVNQSTTTLFITIIASILIHPFYMTLSGMDSYSLALIVTIHLVLWASISQKIKLT